MNNEKTMQEKVEQMAKNAEMKIQQTKEKERKYQENLEFQKKNNPNFRDYDKDPIIIKNIDEIFSSSVVVVALVIIYIYIMIDKNLSIIDLINAKGGFVSLVDFIVLCVMIYKMILSYKNRMVKD